MVEVIWTAHALDGIDNIAAFIALDNPEAAAKLIAKLLTKADHLQQFPNLGRRLPELPDSDYRELIMTRCRAIYRQQGERLFIIHVQRYEQRLRLPSP